MCLCLSFFDFVFVPLSVLPLFVLPLFVSHLLNTTTEYNLRKGKHRISPMLCVAKILQNALIKVTRPKYIKSKTQNT